jgi:hypothetical protein
MHEFFLYKYNDNFLKPSRVTSRPVVTPNAAVLINCYLQNPPFKGICFRWALKPTTESGVIKWPVSEVMFEQGVVTSTYSALPLTPFPFSFLSDTIHYMVIFLAQALLLLCSLGGQTQGHQVYDHIKMCLLLEF